MLRCLSCLYLQQPWSSLGLKGNLAALLPVQTTPAAPLSQVTPSSRQPQTPHRALSGSAALSSTPWALRAPPWSQTFWALGSTQWPYVAHPGKAWLQLGVSSGWLHCRVWWHRSGREERKSPCVCSLTALLQWPDLPARLRVRPRRGPASVPGLQQMFRKRAQEILKVTATE